MICAEDIIRWGFWLVPCFIGLGNRILGVAVLFTNFAGFVKHKPKRFTGAKVVVLVDPCGRVDCLQDKDL